jgi:hypothetical protein
MLERRDALRHGRRPLVVAEATVEVDVDAARELVRAAGAALEPLREPP